MKGKIPISTAKAISEKHDCPIVLIFGIDRDGRRYQITTYGETKALCRLAASYSEQIADAISGGTIAALPAEPMDLPSVPTQFESA